MRKKMFESVVMSIVLSMFLVLFLQVAAFAGPEEFPSFYYYGNTLDDAYFGWPNESDLIFPSVIKATDYFTSPLGTYYMYFSSHAHDGIGLAYSNSLEGPWTVYSGNPIISGGYASPHALWVSEESKLFLWYHGGNEVTHYATSANGINFSYQGVAVNTSSWSSASISEASYAKVFKYTIPTKNNKYILMLMGNNNGTRRIYLAWSNDARTWTTQATSLIDPPGGTAVTQLCSPFYRYHNGKHYVFYHGDESVGGRGDIYATEVGPNFDQSRFVGKIIDASQDPTGTRVADPFIYQEPGGNILYMFICTGPRLGGKIGLTRGYLDGTGPGPTATPRPALTPTPTPTAVPTPIGTNLALNKAVTVSAYESTYTGPNAVDGNTGTRWASGRTDSQWIYVDLGAQYNLSNVVLNWEAAYGKSYKIQVSNDAATWTDVYSTTTGDGGIDNITFSSTNARYVKMLGILRGTQYGYSLWEFGVYDAGATPTPTPTVTPTPTPTATPIPTPGTTPTVVKVESENYSSMSGILLETCSDTGGGQDIANCSNGDWAAYNSMNFGTGVSSIDLRIASNNSGGTVELRLDSTTGTLIGSKAISSTGGWQVWTTVNVPVTGASGTHTLYFVFKKSDTAGVTNINWFQYSRP
jgi:hypothetical protein